MSKGKINWLNPPGNKGNILSTDETPGKEYQFNIPQDIAPVTPTYNPVVGNDVTFDKTGGYTASSIKLVSTGGASIDYFYHFAANNTLSWKTTGATSANINEVGCPFNSDPTDQFNYGSEPFTLTINGNLSQIAQEK